MEHLDYKDRTNLLAAILDKTVAETSDKVDLPFGSGNLVTSSENSDHASAKIVETVQNWILAVLGLSTTYNAPLDGLRNKFIIMLWGIACACTVVFLVVDLFLEDGFCRSLFSPRSRRSRSPGTSPSVSPAIRLRRNVFFNDRKSDKSPSSLPSKASLLIFITANDIIKSKDSGLIDKYIISMQDDNSILLLVLVNDQNDVSSIRDGKCVNAILEHEILFIQSLGSIVPMIQLLGRKKILTTFQLPDDLEVALKKVVGSNNMSRCTGITGLEELVRVVSEKAESSICDVDQNNTF